MKGRKRYIVQRPKNNFEIIFNLNVHQRQAVMSKSKRILAIAGAGSGKTTVLVSRIAYHFNLGIKMDNVLALTFTRLAGKEMKERIITTVGKKEGYKVFCNTFHAFCLKVLKEWGYLIGYGDEFSVYDLSQREAIINEIIDGLKVKVKPEDVIYCLEKEINKYEDTHLVTALRVAEEYRYRIKRANATDLDLLLWDTLKLFKEFPEVQQHYHNLYKYVYVDEFQDTNDVQYEFLELLNPVNLFIVGDPNQAIYGWRNAKIEYILNFSKLHPGCEVIKLEDNYRSTHQVVKAANTLISHSPESIDFTLRAHKDGSNIEYFEAFNEDEEIKFVIDNIKANGMMYGYDDFAVLARTNRQLAKFEEKLRAYNIPCAIAGKKENVLKNYHVKKVIGFIEAINNLKDDNVIKEIITYPENRLTKLETQRMDLEVLNSDTSLFEVLEQSNCEKAIEFTNILKELKDFSESVESPSHLYIKVIQKLDLLAAMNSSNKGKEYDNLLLGEIDIERWEEKQEEVGEPTDFISFLEWYKTRDLDEINETDTSKNEVRLMTVHASKGLEFENVFIIGLNQDMFPSRKGDLAEEMRLMYVAITRAKSNLYYLRTKMKKQPWGDYRELPTTESAFISQSGVA